MLKRRISGILRLECCVAGESPGRGGQVRGGYRSSISTMTSTLVGTAGSWMVTPRPVAV